LASEDNMEAIEVEGIEGGCVYPARDDNADILPSSVGIQDIER